MAAQPPVFTTFNECQDCYKCVRHCHAKAIRIENGHAAVIQDACVACGECVRVCPAHAKKIRPDRFCDTGLYRIVRCPNYFAEILFWTGCFISGIGSLSGWQWAVAALGYVCIVYIMFGGARRLELRQNRRYGEDPEYREYVSRTPIILPLVPLYSVAKYTFLKG